MGNIYVSNKTLFQIVVNDFKFFKWIIYFLTNSVSLFFGNLLTLKYKIRLTNYILYFVCLYSYECCSDNIFDIENYHKLCVKKRKIGERRPGDRG